jgi:hypothetical protein
MDLLLAGKNQSRHCGGSGSECEVILTPVVVFVVVPITVTVAVAVAWRLELAILPQVTVSGQYFPFIRFARLQSC